MTVLSRDKVARPNLAMKQGNRR